MYNKKTWGIIHLVRAQMFPKNIHFLPLIHIRACTLLGVRNISFSDHFAFHIWIKRTYWMNDPFGPNFLNTFQKKSYTGAWPSKYFGMHYKVKWIKPGPGLFSGIFNFKKWIQLHNSDIKYFTVNLFSLHFVQKHIHIENISLLS